MPAPPPLQFYPYSALPNMHLHRQATTTTRTVLTRDLSTDNTINIIFGILAAVIGFFSVVVAWATWRLTLRDRRHANHVGGGQSGATGDDVELQPLADNRGQYQQYEFVVRPARSV